MTAFYTTSVKMSLVFLFVILGKWTSAAPPNEQPITTAAPTGREECNCNTQGVDKLSGSEDLDLTCDAESGKCHCRCDVDGDKCDACVAGHHTFPDCHDCNCNVEGSTSTICDKDTGACDCKSDLITGTLCDQSVDGYFGFPTPEECHCNEEGSEGITCDDGSGKCSCKADVVGDKCNQCAAEHFGFPNCQDCLCHAEGAVDNTCHDNGKCSCNTHVEGEKCDKCFDGFAEFPNCDKCAAEHYGYPNCQDCECNMDGSVDNSCDINTGKCTCKPNVSGDKCDQSTEGYFGFPGEPQECHCNEEGSVSVACDEVTGKCTCHEHITGDKCDQIIEGYFGFPTPQPCECNADGSQCQNCDENGKCLCKAHVVGNKCDTCATGFVTFPHCDTCDSEFFGYPDCKECTCIAEGSVTQQCDAYTGVCTCNTNIIGNNCDEPAVGYFGFPTPEECLCNDQGSLNATCDVSGKCSCKDFVIGDKCSECEEEHFGFPDCKACECNPEGSEDNFCNVDTGHCYCKTNNIAGDNCEKCAETSSGFPNCLILDCNCDSHGSIDNSCNATTGVCSCKANFANDKCDACAAGFTNYPVCEVIGFAPLGITFEALNADRFLPINEKLTFDEAKENCNNMGAKLFEPRNYHEDKFVMNLTKQNDIEAYWIGINRGLDGKSVYSSDNASLSWSHFEALAKPEKQHTPLCTVISFNNGMGGWKDKDCSLKRHSVCDKHIEQLVMKDVQVVEIMRRPTCEPLLSMKNNEEKIMAIRNESYHHLDMSKYLKLAEQGPDPDFTIPPKEDSFNDLQWPFHELENDADINIQEGWKTYLSATNNSNNGKEVIIAVIDSGIDYTHPDLKDIMWKNPGESGEGREDNGIDDDNNGYVDDVHGWDFTMEDKTNIGHRPQDPMDTNGHGTHCAGIIYAKPNGGGLLGAGVTSYTNGKVKLMALKIMADNEATQPNAINALKYAIDHGAKISSNSYGVLGKEKCQNYLTTIDDILSNHPDHLFVSAAGNENNNNDDVVACPCDTNVANAICVAASTREKKKYEYSNYGSKGVAVFAPGENIASLWKNQEYRNSSGTSMATPFVSGLAALILSIKSDLSGINVKEIITSNVQSMSSRQVSSGGLIDIAKTLKYLTECSAISTNEDCCSSASYLCGHNQGNCKSNDDCLSGLTCENTCPDDFPVGYKCCFNSAPRCSASNTDHQCCTKEEKCSIGEGDCDLDDDCQEGLICGVDNCDSGFPGTEYDCCQQPLDCNEEGSVGAVNNECACKDNIVGTKCDKCDTGYYNFPTCQACNCDAQGSEGTCDDNGLCSCKEHVVGDKCHDCKEGYKGFPDCEEDKSCNGKDNCCTSSNPCAIGDGDCNEHTDCAEGLFCGDNNCAGSGLWGNGGFSYLDDCCTDEPPPPCNGKDNCCKPSNPCAKGDGDCNSDSDCAAGLFCGHNNCDGAGVFGFSDFTIYDDCCTDVPPPPPPPPPSIWNPGTWFGSPPPPPPPPSSSGSCLLGSTLILMQNYTSKPITEIKHGDMILDGNLNSVSVHSVITNYLYDRKMYDFKDGPVFTEDHLFYSNIETEELAAASPSHLFIQVPQMKEWKIKPIKDTNQLLQYRNGTVKPLKFDYSEYQAMDPATKVYWLITSGKDGSYIADNFVARHEMPKFEDWPFTYATIGLVLNSSNLEDLPMDSIEDDAKFQVISSQLVDLWKNAVENFVYDSSLVNSCDPFEVIKSGTIFDSLTPSKLKIAQLLDQNIAQHLHELFDNDDLDQNERCSLMNHIVDQSEAFLKNGNDNATKKNP